MTTLGVNGATVLTEEAVGDPRIPLYTMLVRGESKDEITRQVRAFPSTMHEDLWLIAFQTRDIRGGKGERQIFYHLFRALHDLDPRTAQHMLKIVPEYGYWKDLIELLPIAPTAILSILREQYAKDVNHYRKDEPSKLSLLAKWLPREPSHPRLARQIAKALYPDTPARTRMIIYRKMCAAMNKDIKTVEVNMCANQWAEIEPSRVPGRAMKCYRDAFLSDTYGTEDRALCREHFLAYLEDVKAGRVTVKGVHVVMPHEIVAAIPASRGAAMDLLQAQWNAIREETERAGGLGRAVPLCDFSGSMSGMPMNVSLALGILISEVNHSAFRDRMITFDSTPSWVTFPSNAPLQEKIKATRRVSQGLSTNFYGACRLILNTLLEKKVPRGEEPEDLIVVTDMGFDAATGIRGEDNQAFQISLIHNEFVDAGYTPPRIVVWNVRAAYRDFHATAHQHGVVQLSGWSPNVLKALQQGITVKTPYQGLQATLDDPRYDLVREQFRSAPK